MADTNTYNSFQKVEKWTTKEKFNALDPRTIETGTEYNLAGAIDESDLASDLRTKINGKLTAPTTPSAESAVTMLADGTVGTKPLSEIGGGKLYRHEFVYNCGDNSGPPVEINFMPLYSTVSIEYTEAEMFRLLANLKCPLGTFFSRKENKTYVCVLIDFNSQTHKFTVMYWNGTSYVEYDTANATVTYAVNDNVTEV